MELYGLTIHELQDKLRAGQTTSAEITASVFGRIDAVEKDVRAYITLMRKSALGGSGPGGRADQKGGGRGAHRDPHRPQGHLLHAGVPHDLRLPHPRQFHPPLRRDRRGEAPAAGAVFTGKTNMDEFAMGSSTETSHFGTTRNPWDLGRIPGGSSGGSAAAVAADECIAALGSDTGGSIRQPAALCGVVGMKPTYGRVSRYGLIAFASSLDQIGPFTKDVEDCAIVMNVIAGYDPRESTSVPEEVPDYRRFLGRGVEEWTVGIPKEYFVAGIDPEVEAAVRRAIAVLEQAGARCIEVSLPHTKYCLAVYYIVAPAEASSNLARYDGVRYGFRSEENRDLLDMYKKTRSAGFGAEVKRRIMLGTYALSSGYYDAYYKKASQVRALIKRDFDQAFTGCDVDPHPDDADRGLSDRREDRRSDADVPLRHLHDFGKPGRDSGDLRPLRVHRGGLPIGVQFLAGHFQEGRLIQIASAYEKAANIEKRRPSL